MRAVWSAGALAHPQHVIIRRARAAACSVLRSAPVVPVPQTTSHVEIRPDFLDSCENNRSAGPRAVRRPSQSTGTGTR